MKGRWRIAKVVNNEVSIPITAVDGPPRHVAQLTLRLIEPYRFNGKKVGKIFTSFSDNPNAFWRVKEFMRAVQVQGLNHLPDKQLNGRYCKILIDQEEYDKMIRLRIGRFAPLNKLLDLTPPPVPVEPEIVYTHKGLSKLKKVDLIEEVLKLHNEDEYDD